MLKEFKDFAIKGNMLDMAVGEIPLEATRCRCCTSELE
ncbi:MAG: MscL family protein [Lachnospiraceae bacterium]|nr:MscL family protein [Lachnospiraceae bacterium]